MLLDFCKTLKCLFLVLMLCFCLSQAKPKHHRHRGHHRHHRHHRDPCPDGWTEHDESCYKHVSDELSWQDAADNCARYDAHLVTIDSDDEANWLCSRLSQLLRKHWGLCPAWWTAGRSDDGSWIWYRTQSVYEVLIRSNKWFGGKPDARSLDNYGVTMQLTNGYFGLIARSTDTLLPSVCEKEIDRSESHDSDSSSRGSHGRHSRGSSSRGRSHSHSHSRSRSESREHHSRSSDSSDSDESYGYSSSRWYRRNPYSPHYPRPGLPDKCKQPQTTVAPTTTPTTTTELTTTTTQRTTTRETTTTTSVPSTEAPGPCPPGWLSFSTSCYQIHDSCAQTHYTAQRVCELVGGHLVTINTKEEEDFLTSKLDKRKEWWISAKSEDGEWTWEDDDSDSSSESSSSGDDEYLFIISQSGQNNNRYINWHQQEPSKYEDNTYAVLSWSNGHWGWRSRSGNSYKNYICEVDKSKVRPGCLTPSCQYNIDGVAEIQEWSKFLDNEYLVHDSCAKTRSDAAGTCRSMGAQLLTINSSAEMRFVQRMLRSKSYDMADAPNWWTNGMKSQGRWRWQGSRNRLVYTNWGPNISEPRGNFMILHYYPFYDDWMWTDTKPSQVLPFICKRAGQ